MKTTTLYRPVGLGELMLIMQSGWKRFPPRLSWQPIFYPVLNEAYAAQIAREWNTQDAFGGYCGIVTRFDADAAYLSTYEIQNVGNALHNELWVPAAELEAFNAHICGQITVTQIFTGEGFVMPEEEELKTIFGKIEMRL